MNIFVPEYITLVIVLLVFGYHMLKDLTSDDEAHETKHGRRMSRKIDHKWHLPFFHG